MKVQLKDGGYLIDDSIMLYEGSTSPLWEELQEWLVKYKPLPEYTEQEIAEQEIARLKAEKEQRLNTLVVTTSNGNSFDGNLEARTNMTSAILSADLLGLKEENWKLADNSIKLIQLSELKEALALAIQEVGNIVKDY